ncbi:MAG: hypothetical protein ABGX16_12690 [Pirellulales bacterium]
MRLTSTLLTLVSVLVACPIAYAQSVSHQRAPQISSSRRVALVEAVHHHSSTAYEGALRGEAVWRAAQGDFLQDQSQAAYVWKHVESMHYDNYLKKTTTALARKQKLADHREQGRQARRSRREAGKRILQEKVQDLAVTYHLDENEFNSDTGVIVWPAVVADPRYSQYRQRLDGLMHEGIRYGLLGSSSYRNQISKACTAFRNHIRKNAAHDHPSTRGEYLAMQRFLLGLKYAPYRVALMPTGEQLTQDD